MNPDTTSNRLLREYDSALTAINNVGKDGYAVATVVGNEKTGTLRVTVTACPPGFLGACKYLLSWLKSELTPGKTYATVEGAREQLLLNMTDTLNQVNLNAQKKLAEVSASDNLSVIEECFASVSQACDIGNKILTTSREAGRARALLEQTKTDLATRLHTRMNEVTRSLAANITKSFAARQAVCAACAPVLLSMADLQARVKPSEAPSFAPAKRIFVQLQRSVLDDIQTSLNETVSSPLKEQAKSDRNNAIKRLQDVEGVQSRDNQLILRLVLKCIELKGIPLANSERRMQVQSEIDELALHVNVDKSLNDKALRNLISGQLDALNQVRALKLIKPKPGEPYYQQYLSAYNQRKQNYDNTENAWKAALKVFEKREPTAEEEQLRTALTRVQKQGDTIIPSKDLDKMIDQATKLGQPKRQELLGELRDGINELQRALQAASKDPDDLDTQLRICNLSEPTLHELDSVARRLSKLLKPKGEAPDPDYADVRGQFATLKASVESQIRARDTFVYRLKLSVADIAKELAAEAPMSVQEQLDRVKAFFPRVAKLREDLKALEGMPKMRGDKSVSIESAVASFKESVLVLLETLKHQKTGVLQRVEREIAALESDKKGSYATREFARLQRDYGDEVNAFEQRLKRLRDKAEKDLSEIRDERRKHLMQALGKVQDELDGYHVQKKQAEIQLQVLREEESGLVGQLQDLEKQLESDPNSVALLAEMATANARQKSLPDEIKEVTARIRDLDDIIADNPARVGGVQWQFEEETPAENAIKTTLAAQEKRVQDEMRVSKETFSTQVEAYSRSVTNTRVPETQIADADARLAPLQKAKDALERDLRGIHDEQQRVLGGNDIRGDQIAEWVRK